jgi:hypothetical protein
MPDESSERSMFWLASFSDEITTSGAMLMFRQANL